MGNIQPAKIILIVIDSLRADHLGCYGYKRNTSPNIDSLVRESIHFKWAFSTVSYTCPSFASLLTSLYPSKHSIGFHQKFPKLDKDRELLLSEIIKSSGYSTAAFIGAMVLREDIGLNSGFDFYDADLPEGRRSSDKINKNFFTWLDNNHRNNFFSMLHYFDVHLPYKPPQPYSKEFLNDSYFGLPKYLDVMPDGWGYEGEIPQIGGIPKSAILTNKGSIERDSRYYTAQYDGCIRYVDNAIGDVIEKLKRLDIYDECLIIITADHGEAMGENNVWFYHSLTVTPDQIHVPLIVKPPKEWGIKPKIIETHVSLVDIFPTICELVGFDHYNLDIDGKSLIRLIENGRDQELESRTIVSEIEGQIAYIDKEKIEIKPKEINKDKLVFFYVEELCNKEMVFNYRGGEAMLEWTGERYVPWMEPGEIHYEHLHRYRFATEFVKGRKVLDLACGEGYGSFMMSQEAGEVIGVDLDEVTIRHAFSKYIKENLKFIKGSITDIPIEGEKIFDVIVCFEALEHIEEHDELMKEVKRLLKEDGTFIVSTPNKYVYSDKADYQNPYHLRELYFDEFKTLLNNNFKNTLIYGQKVYPSSNIFPLFKGSLTTKDYVIEKGDKGFLSVPPERKEARYFIAVSSDVPIIDISGNSYLVDVSETLFKQKDVHIGNLEAMVKEKDVHIGNLEATIKDKDVHIGNLESAIRDKETQISYLEVTLKNIYNSHGWRALLIYYKARDKVLPLGTRRRKATSFIWKFVSGIFQKWGFLKRETSHRKSEVIENNKPLISVIIPVYDRTEMLKESIESILHQAYQNFELLLVCDGSPPETMDVVNKYASNPRVRIFRYKDNSGTPVRGRNKGIREAKGKYTAFHDSDDIAEPNRLEISCRYAEEYDADVVYGTWRIKKEKGAYNHDKLSNDQKVYSPDCDYVSLKRGTNFLCQSTAMVKTEALINAGGLKPEMHYCEDYELWLRLAYLGYKFKSIPQILTTLRLHSNNLESRFKEKEKIYIQKAIAEHKVIPRFKPSIAFFIPGQGISGGIGVICQHANRLIKKGLDVVLINTNLNDPFRLDWFPNLLSEVIPINRIDQNIDIAIATQWSTAFTVRDFPAKKKLYFVQSDETRFYASGSEEAKLAWETYTFDFEYVVIARWLKRWLRDNFGKSAHYVPNGLDTSIFFPEKPLTPKNNKLRVLLEGPIDIPLKGMDNAFQIVDGMDCEVWCVSSSGRPKRGWKCDRFFEKVPLEKMRRIYSSCDVLVKMSKVEGFFMPPLEMMACGGTVITGKVTGYDEYIVDGYNALVVEEGDVESAREKLILLINDRNLLHRLIKGGLETVKNWTWEYSNDQLEKIIKRELQAN